MKHFLKAIMITGVLGCHLSANATDLSINGEERIVYANGGMDSLFVPFVKTYDIRVTSTSGKCQNSLTLDTASVIGQVMADGELFLVFDGGGDAGFTLDYRSGNDWKAVGSGTISCPSSGSVQFRANFYRKTSVPTIDELDRHILKTINITGTPNHTLTINMKLTLKSKPITYGCQVLSGSQTITLNKVSAGSLINHTRVKNGNVATINLDCNNAGAKVMAMVYDNLNPSNFGANKTALTLDSSSDSAKGVGVELYYNNGSQPLPLGQKTTTTPLAFDNTYWEVVGGDKRTLSLSAGYVKTGDITSGKVKAQAGIVLVYP